MFAASLGTGRTVDRDGLLGEGGRKEATLLRAERTVETRAAQAGLGGKATGGNPRALGRGASWCLGPPLPLPCFIFLLSIYRNLSGYPFYQVIYFSRHLLLIASLPKRRSVRSAPCREGFGSFLFIAYPWCLHRAVAQQKFVE